MNYYDETLDRIKGLFAEKQYEEAKRLILNELELPYVPKDFEEELYVLLRKIKEATFHNESLNDEDIAEYLKMDEMHQMIAVEELDKRNLRNELEICQKYLSGGGFLDAKLLLIDSLISQQIDHVFVLKKNEELIEFDPAKLKPVCEAQGFKACLKALEETFMKEPSMLVLAKQLLYKEALYALPLNIEEKDASYLAEKIEKYIRKAFE